MTGIQLNLDWDTHPPKLVWRQPIGAGWSGFAVVGNSAITQEQEDDWEKVVCYELHTGEVKWSHKDHARYNMPPAGLGPRATPTISGNRVYTVGATGILNCLDLETGEPLWTTHTFEENKADLPPWGVSISPLVFDELVIVSAGGAVAYHKDTGEIVWTGYRTQSGYSSPLLTTLAGTEQVVIFNQGLITAQEPFTGKLLWKQPWVQTYAECVAQPVPISDDTLLFSNRLRCRCEALSTLSRIPPVNSTFQLYGKPYTSKQNSPILSITKVTCTDSMTEFSLVSIQPTAHVNGKAGRYGHGQTLLISDVLLVTTESGEVVLIEPDPERHIEHARFAAIKGKTWNTPALAGPYLLVRNDREAACYQLPIIDTTTDTGTD